MTGQEWVGVFALEGTIVIIKGNGYNMWVAMNNKCMPKKYIGKQT